MIKIYIEGFATLSPTSLAVSGHRLTDSSHICTEEFCPKRFFFGTLLEEITAFNIYSNKILLFVLSIYHNKQFYLYIHDHELLSAG